MASESPVVVLFNTDGYEVSVKDNTTIPVSASGILVSGTDGTNSQFISVNSSGQQVVVGAGAAGSGSGGILTIQGDSSGTPVPITGTITASNQSIGFVGSATPASATQIGASDGTNNQVPRVFDLDSGAGSQYALGVNLRKSASGGSVELGTSSDPIRIDPTGTTTQPISAASLPLPSGAATESTLSTRLADATFTNRINTLGQKTMANSTPVVLSSDQSTLSIAGVGTAGTPSGGVLSIQGVSGGTNVPVSGTITANIGTSGSLALDTTLAKLTISQSTALGSNTQVMAGGSVSTSAPTYTSGNINPLSLTTSGALRVDASATTQPVSGSGNFTVVQSTAGNLNATVVGLSSDNTTNSTAKIPVIGARANTSAPSWTDGYMVPLSVDTAGALRVSGTITANNSSVSSTGAAPPGSATYIGGSVTTSAPTYTTGQMNALSLTTGGLLRVDGSGVTQPVSGTVAATQSGTWTVQPGNTANTTPWLTTISQGGNSATVSAGGALKVDGSAVTQPVSGTITANAGTGNFSTNLAQYSGSSVGAGNAIHVQPGTGATFAVSGTVTANIGTSGSLALDATLTGGTQKTKITDGTNDAAVKAASTSALATDPALVVAVSPNNTVKVVGAAASGSAVTGNPVLAAGSDGTNARTLKAFSDGTLQVKQRESATFTATATAVAPANNKSMISFQNANGSTVKLKLHEIYIINVQQANVTGVVVNFELRRATSHAAGTAITAIETMDTTDTLDSNITVRTNATITSESATLLWRAEWSSDEWGTNTLDAESNEHLSQTMFPIYSRKTLDLKPIVLNANECFTVKCATNTTVGSFDMMVVFTQE